MSRVLNFIHDFTYEENGTDSGDQISRAWVLLNLGPMRDEKQGSKERTASGVKRNRQFLIKNQDGEKNL